MRRLASEDSEPASAGSDRKSTRLNSSHGYISYAVFCLKKKKMNNDTMNSRGPTLAGGRSNVAETNLSHNLDNRRRVPQTQCLRAELTCSRTTYATPQP